MGPIRPVRVRRRGARRAACAAIAVAALAGCAPDDRPGPRGLLRIDAPVLVAMDGSPVADGVLARSAAAPRDAGARMVSRVAAGVGAMAVTPGARMLAAPLAVLDAAPAVADCPARDDALREAVDTLRAALRPVAHAATEAMRVGVDRDWHPTRPDPVVAAGAPPRLDVAREAGHRTLLRIGPVTLSPITRATPDGPGCRAVIEARVVLRAIRTADGGVRFESERRLTLAEAPDEDALRAWAADPGRVEDALRRLGDRIADDVRWLL